MRLRIETTFGKQDDSIDIVAPENVDPKSLQEMIEESIRGVVSKQSTLNAKYILSDMRDSAEITYNNKGFSYVHVCEDLHDSPYYRDMDFQCFAGKDKYMVYVSLESQTNFFCIDSSGNAVETNIEPEGKTFVCPLVSVNMPPVPGAVY